MGELLQPEILPLTGCHLIEASAGTGKTYNITRIYLRLLLERQLDVKNILVMTFTRAATEELRGRIAKELRDALENWGNFPEHDSFYTALTAKFSIADVSPALNNALLNLDEAAIFTIHSFCNRVLSQHAFSSGVDFNIQMEADTAEIELEAVRDWYRILAKTDDYELLSNNWPSPEDFRQVFYNLLSNSTAVQGNDPEALKQDFQARKKQALEAIKDSQTFIFQQLIEGHAKEDIRAEEWQSLIDWLNSDYADDTSPLMPKSASNVFHGARYGKKPPEIKQQLLACFQAVKQLKDDAGKIETQIQKAKAYQIARQGIVIIREKIITEKQRSRLMNYDDLINQLSIALDTNALETNALEATESQPENILAELIRTQYPVALVDEFQDTDPQQYHILKAVYHQQENAALYMIGDPKQAIYAFRGGDVFTYLAARNDADQQWVMNTNWRSSSAMVNAYNRLFYGAPLNASAKDIFKFGIQYSPVNSGGLADKKALSSDVFLDDASQAALQFIHFPFNEDYKLGNSKKDFVNQDFCEVIAHWCSKEIDQLLNSNTCIGEQTLQEQDIAILVRDKKEAAFMQDALRLAGYPSVYLSTHDNVFSSDEALELERVLSGILSLENDRLLIAALSTRLLGGDIATLIALQEDEQQWEAQRDRVFNLRVIWFKRGFMAMALEILHEGFKPHPQHHERSLTNAIQLLELLQQASQRHRQPEQLLNWLREQIDTQGANAEAELRLESDANLIRIITQHGCKGLEYPVVFIPFATRYKNPIKFGNKNIDLFKYHDPNHNNRQSYFMGQDSVISEQYCQEEWAESIRLLYVAITRAEHRCYVCATVFKDYHLSALGQILQLSDESDLASSLQMLSRSEGKPDSHYVAVSGTDFTVVKQASTQNSMALSPASFTARIERNWWLSSFSALTRNLRHGGISTPDRDQDEQIDQPLASKDKSDTIRFTLTKGAAAGNLLHDILEHTDFSQPLWQRSFERPIARFNEVLDEDKQHELMDWLDACLETPLGVDENSPRLSDLSWVHTLRETEFYFPMEQVKPLALGRLLANHRQQRQMTTAFTINPIQLPGNKALQGMMHGFIDLIYHWQGKYYIVDYKSTHLGNDLSAYQTDNLEKNIRDNYYDLQYLLYSLALHRYLKLRLSDYEPQQHFGGIHYLYLRGMTPDPKTHTGIFSADISAELLQELDNLFDGKDVPNNVIKNERTNNKGTENV